MILQYVVCVIDVFIALACFSATVADRTEHNLRVVDLLMALFMILNIVVIMAGAK